MMSMMMLVTPIDNDKDDHDDEGDDKADHDDDDGDDDDGDGVGDDTSSVLLYRVLFWLCFCISQFSISYC